MFAVQDQFWFRKQTYKVTQQSQGQTIITDTHMHTHPSAHKAAGCEMQALNLGYF